MNPATHRGIMAQTDDAAHSLSIVAESAVALATAELKLAVSKGKAWFTRIGRGVLFAYLGLLFAQVSILLVALSPLLLSVRPWPIVLLSVGLGVVPAAIFFLVARWEFGRLKALPPMKRRPTADISAPSNSVDV